MKIFTLDLYAHKNTIKIYKYNRLEKYFKDSIKNKPLNLKSYAFKNKYSQ